MRHLLSAPDELDVADLYPGLTLPDGRETPEGFLPSIALGMVSTADGGATVGGLTAALGGAADEVAFRRLRGACDAILVGAGTARDEDYGPPGGDAQRQADRVARGLPPRPRLVLVTGSLSLDPGARLFADPNRRPLVITHGDAPLDREAALREVADVVRIGGHEVDLPAACRHLGELGLRRILCEGGPRLNGALFAADLVDEVFVTIAPVAVGGDAPRIAAAAGEGTPRDLQLVDAHEHRGELVLRYRVVR